MDSTKVEIVAKKYLDSIYRAAVNYSKNAQDAGDAVMHLPAKYSIVLHLYYYEGYSVDEISKIVGLTQSNVQIRLMRGRKMLRESLEGGQL